jgi:NAD-dependent SIR2 family protein deacetylase
MDTELFSRCADAIEWADGLLVTAGAGMGLDSGLPDFRGRDGFWRAYPALAKAGIAFHDIASPETFHRDPRLAWGFYGHRLNLYRETQPHRGFALLREFARHMPNGAFVFTSNVDGQFQKAGFPDYRLCEIHGSIHHLQCLKGCPGIWPAEGFNPVVDTEACRLLSELPTCPLCGGLARPNILMFSDGGWQAGKSEEQESRLSHWLNQVKRLLIIEIGAGTSIPTVRHFGNFQECFLIRINPREPDIPAGRRGVSLPMAGLEALREIADHS